MSANGGAVATLVDTINLANRYVLTLTAVGGGTCTLTTGTSTIDGVGYSLLANPATARTYGTCSLYNATVNYLVTYELVGVGSSGSLPIQCVWALATKVCTPTHLHGAVLSGVPV